MNERIKLLAEQAGEYVNSVYTPPIRSKTFGKIWEDGHVGWNEQFQAKFAELIVQECIDQGAVAQSQHVNGSTDYNAGREMGIEVFMNQIKHHFNYSK